MAYIWHLEIIHTCTIQKPLHLYLPQRQTRIIIRADMTHSKRTPVRKFSHTNSLQILERNLFSACHICKSDHGSNRNKQQLFALVLHLSSKGSAVIIQISLVLLL